MSLEKKTKKVKAKGKRGRRPTNCSPNATGDGTNEGGARPNTSKKKC